MCGVQSKDAKCRVVVEWWCNVCSLWSLKCNLLFPHFIFSPISPPIPKSFDVYWTFDPGHKITNKPSCVINHLGATSAFCDLMAKGQDKLHANNSLSIQFWCW